MRSLKWSTSHAVFVTEIDDEHKEIFEAVSSLQDLGNEPGRVAQRLVKCIDGHFAHEERLMRAARYSGLAWHKRQHENARRRVEQFILQMEQGDAEARSALVQYLSDWLRAHTRLADKMMAASLRNHERFLCKVTFRAGTKPMDACAWVDADGDRFDPAIDRHPIS
jgi:hemerythrin-like metal-binding protein